VRRPYVGEGADGAHRSAAIDRSEADQYDSDDPRRQERLDSAALWDAQADGLTVAERPTVNAHWGEQVDVFYERVTRGCKALDLTVTAVHNETTITITPTTTVHDALAARGHGLISKDPA
jgi:hypothetical protein